VALRNLAKARAEAIAEIGEDLPRWGAKERLLDDLPKDLDDMATKPGSMNTAERVDKADERPLSAGP
jgi:hypothetical protein